MALRRILAIERQVRKNLSNQGWSHCIGLFGLLQAVEHRKQHEWSAKMTTGLDFGRTKSLRIRDLAMLTAIVAVNITLLRFAVEFDSRYLSSATILSPTCLTIVVQRRLRFGWYVAAAFHYLSTLIWAFASGFAYAFFWKQTAHMFFERSSTGLETPLAHGLFCTEIMAVFGLATSAIYTASMIVLVGSSRAYNV